MKRLLWDCTEQNRRTTPMARDSVRRPKKKGGLNIIDHKVWNMALIGKLVWLFIHRKEALWVKWIHGIYMKDDPNF